MIITEKLRTKILLHLPKDYQKQGEEALGCSRSLVYKVLHEEHENDRVAEWLIETSRLAKEEKEKTAHKLSKLAQQL